MKTSDRIRKLRLTLLMNVEFSLLAHVFMQCDIVENNNCETMQVSLVNKTYLLEYNSEFTDKLTDKEVIGVLLHELLHIVLKHVIRIFKRDPNLWNIAADYVVNDLLLYNQQYNNLYILPKGYLYDSQYAKMSVELIYEKLKAQSNQNQQNKSSQWGSIVNAQNTTSSEATNTLDEALTDVMITQASASAGKRHGDLSNFSDMIIKETKKKRVNWSQILYLFLTQNAKNDYSFKKPNRRNLTRGIITPTLSGQTIDSICIFVDVSGSVSQKELEMCAGEISDILDQFKCEVTVLFGDTKIQSHETYTTSDLPLVFKTKGGGGTDFRLITPYLEEIGVTPNVLIILTDGYVSSFGNEPEYPVLMFTFEDTCLIYPCWINHYVMNN